MRNCDYSDRNKYSRHIVFMKKTFDPEQMDGKQSYIDILYTLI